MTDTNTYAILKEDTDYLYIRDIDGGSYAVNKLTGEVTRAVNALIPEGSNTFTPEQQKRYKEKKAKEKAYYRQKDANKRL